METTDLWALFQEPPRRFSPAPIWWWSGERLDPQRLRWQLERLAEGGVYNLVILNLAPTSPLYGADPDDPPFRSETWWRILRQVCLHARDLGMFLWFYDQLGFSGANLQAEVVRAQPAFAGLWLARLTHDTREPVDLRCPAGGLPLGGCALPLTATGQPAGSPQPLPLEDGVLRWRGRGPHRLMLFYAITRGFDYLQSAACQALFALVHEEFARRLGDFFGSVIVGSFQDELPSLPTWSRLFAAEFRRRCGYDLVSELAHLWEDLGPESGAIRGDYHRVRAALAEEAFFQPLFAWHERYGLLCGFDQQGPARAGYPVEATRFYADYLRTHRWYGAPGSDHHGEAKIHSSLAHLYRRPRVWIEAFHSSGWGGTLEETFDWLLPWIRAGANLYDPHAVYYSTKGGWWEWAPPSTCWRQPYWRHYRQFATAVSRLCAVLSQGTHLCDIGVLYPTATIQAGLTAEGATAEAQRAHEIYLALVGRMYWQAPAPGILDRDRRDFDVLDDDSIQRAQVADGALLIGDERYRAVILPACTVLAAETAQVLAHFVASGGILIAVGAPPERTAGRQSDAAALTGLRQLFTTGRARLVARPEAVPEALADLPRRVEAPVPTLLRRVGQLTCLFVPAAFPGATRHHTTEDWRRVDYDFTPDRYAQTMTVTVREVSGTPVLWELTTGRRRPLPATWQGDRCTVTIPFDDAPAALVVWEPSPAAPELSTPGSTSLTVVAELTGLWEIEIVPTLENRWGDVAWPPSPGAPPVQRWRFRYRRERPGEEGVAAGWARPDYDDTAWEEVHATFGPYGWWTGPARPDDLPSPTPVGAEVPPLATEGWRPIIYSLSRGILRDRLHQATLGPKGHVPEEFLDFGPLAPGQAVQFRTAIFSEAATTTTLAVGAPVRKEAWLNGEPLGADEGGYLWLRPVRLRAGWNVLELRLTAEEEVTARAYYAFVLEPEAFQRPEWLTPGDPPRPASVLRFRRTVTLAAPPQEARIQVAADAPARLLVNGQEVGRQGGFDPYDHRRIARVQPYDIQSVLRPGSNEIVVELLDLGQPCAVLVDALVVTISGERVVVTSDRTWEASRDGQPVPLALRRRQWLDPAWCHLWRRPHPLPASRWLEERPDPPVVLSVIADPYPGERRVEWLRFPIPPGAVAMRLPAITAEEVTVFIDGAVVPVHHGRVDLPAPTALRRLCALRLIGARGGSGGALLAGPVIFEMGQGRMALGDWEAQGLEAYAGGIAYRQAFRWERGAPRRLWLDLGRVRGTAEVRVNDVYVGSRVWSPYRFEITPALQAGENTVEIRVFNTLAPYLAAVSPTHYIFPGQTVSGLFGPVRLLAEASGEE